MVNVVQEQVQRADALFQAAFEQGPFVGRDDARDQVEGKNFLRAAVIVVDRERDALRQEGRVGEGTLALELVLAHALEAFEEGLVMGTRLDRAR